SFLALIAAVVLAIILIVKKEKRRQMKKTKIAAVVSALLVPVMSFISVVNWYASTLVIIEPVGWMPDLVGLDYDECKFAYDGLFELIYEEEYSYEYPKGVIIWQDTAPHSIIYSPGKEVHCAVSKGVRTIDVADVIGLDSDEAKKTLEENCFTVILALKYSDDISKGNVIATDPPAGEKAAYGSAVKVTVSGGKEPDVTDNGTAP
ncbi:MAG: PASTA domain-containing protein, partial [Oscillospiraceae bacterium]|nr:PASTA domain-containing protein [Oscillospiraceae bacterium]